MKDKYHIDTIYKDTETTLKQLFMEQTKEVQNYISFLRENIKTEEEKWHPNLHE